jgi:benzoate-CoA ligase family protein
VGLALPDIFNAAEYFVDRHVREGRGDLVAIECGDARITYREVFERTNQAGNGFRRTLDVRPEERIVLILPDTPQFVYTFFGAIKIGAVPIPTSTLWKSADYAYVMNDSRATVLVVDKTFMPLIDAIGREHIPSVRSIVVAGGDGASGDCAFEQLTSGQPTDLAADPTSKDAPAFWLYSSGSTGRPKGCVHLQHDMVVAVEHYAKGVLHINASDRCFSVPKLFFAYGLGNGLYFPFSVGATSILWPGAPTAANVYSAIERHRPTLFFSVPTNFAMLLASRPEARSDFDLSSVRQAVSAGEALPPAIFERFRQRFGVEILDGIGSTEILHIFISNRSGEARPGSSGVIVDGYEAKILDEQDQPVPIGQIGNLLIKGDSICAMYWNKHEKTKDTFQGGWIRTGDKYYQDQDGYYWYAGRSDDMLKVGGIWVSPVEVENVLVEHQSVLECAVCGQQDHDGLVKPVAYVVVKDGVTPSPALADLLRAFVQERLAEYKRPRRIEFLPELPKTATGKIQRYKLRELGRQPAGTEVC